MISEDRDIQYFIPVASEYQEIHSYSAVNIDSVKINTSLIMMREWVVQCTSHPTLRLQSLIHPSFGNPSWDVSENISVTELPD